MGIRSLVVVSLLVSAALLGATRAPETAVAASPATALSEGGVAHRCGIHADGTLTCWGTNESGQSVPAAGTFRSVAAGGDFTCGIRPAHTLECWGRRSMPSEYATDSFRAVAAAERHVCAIRTNGAIVCWGDNDNGELDSPGGRDFVAISGVHDHTCALTTSGEVDCWGSPAGGATQVPPGRYSHVAAGTNRTCAIRTTGTLTCWGDESEGSLLPTPPGRFRDVAANSGAACAIRTDGPLICWGSNGSGILDAPAGSFVDVSVGGNDACAIEESGAVRCWGGYGPGSRPPRAGYEDIQLNPVSSGHCFLRPDGHRECTGAGPSDWIDPASVDVFDMFHQNSCAVSVEGALECWGNDLAGVLDPPAGRFVDVAVGGDFACALSPSGTMRCWGDAAPSPPSGVFESIHRSWATVCGQRVDGRLTCAVSPDAVDPITLPPSDEFGEVALGDFGGCGLLADHSATCWGTDFEGDALAAPVGSFRSLTSALSGFCAVDLSDDSLRCWGDVFHGPEPAGRFEQVELGNDESCALRLDGVVQCWGLTAALGEPFGDEPFEPWPSLRTQAPVRILDTRGHVVTSPGEPHPARAGNTIGLGLQFSVPYGPSAVALSVTVVSPHQAGFVTVWPCDEPQPLASSVNYRPGQVVTNTVIVGTENSEDRVCLMSSASTDLVVDVVGYVPIGGSLANVGPARLADTRAGEQTVDGVGAGTGRVPADSTLQIDVRGRAGVDDDADAVLLNVIAAEPSGPGFLTVFPCGTPRPLASNVNYVDGATTNMAFSAVGTGGRVCVYSSAETDVVADVTAFVPSGQAPVGAPPARLADTRPGERTVDGVAAGTGALGAGATLELDVTGRGGVPAAARTVMLNVTAVNPIADGFLTVYPCGHPFPLASAMTYAAGDVRAVAVPTKVGPDGTVCVYTLATTHVVVDVGGFVAG